jgi:hypothetical protein
LDGESPPECSWSTGNERKGGFGIANPGGTNSGNIRTDFGIAGDCGVFGSRDCPAEADDVLHRGFSGCDIPRNLFSAEMILTIPVNFSRAVR